MTAQGLLASLGISLAFFSGVANTANAQASVYTAGNYAIALNRDTVRFPPGAPINFDGAEAQGNQCVGWKLSCV